tara:strand:- start:221 stop:613 length:393 start_codon:yes stop_codon:yes gene_type:complete
MLDYYSYDIPPTYQEAYKIIKSRYLMNIEHYHNQEKFKDIHILVKNNLEEWGNECIYKSFVDNNILDVSYNIKYMTLGGWIHLGVDNVITSLKNNTELYYLRKMNKNKKNDKKRKFNVIENDKKRKFNNK